MALTRVTPSMLNTKADDLDRIVADFTKSKGKLSEHWMAIGDMWEGKTKAEFTRTITTDEAKFTAMSNLLTRYAAVLRETATTYAKAEAEASQIVATKKY